MAQISTNGVSIIVLVLNISRDCMGEVPSTAMAYERAAPRPLEVTLGFTVS